MQRPLLPKFLKKYDEHLLLHKPEVWSIRTHLVIYYGLLFMATLAVISFLAPDDPREDSLSEIWAGFVSIISFLGLVIWIIYLLRFNVFKRFGTIKPGSRLAMFLLYFIATGVFVLFPYIPSFVESVRANRAYGNEEIVKDINAFNVKICQVEYDSLAHTWKRDTVKVVNKLPGVQKESSIDYEEAPYIDTVVIVDKHHIVIDTAQLRNRLLTSDSTIKMSDSMYIFLTCPQYTFLRVYRSDTYSQEKELSDVDIYRKVIRNYTAPDKEKLRKELRVLIAKYDIDPSPFHTYYENSDAYTQKIREKYELDDVGESINNIVKRKYRWEPDKLDWFFRSFYYITLTIALIIFIFRHSTAKTFFLSLLAAVILTILTALFMAFAGYRETSFFFWMIGYFLLFFFITMLVWKDKVRNAVMGIGINLFVFLIPIMPVISVGCYYAVLRQRYSHLGIEPYDSDVMYTNLFYAEIGGSVLLIVLLLTYIQGLYRKWYSLPEE